MRQRRRALVIMGLMLVAVGVVWIGQGTGFLRGSSFMVDDPAWALAGVILALSGCAVLLAGWRARRS
jgi:hypothetical protein